MYFARCVLRADSSRGKAGDAGYKERPLKIAASASAHFDRWSAIFAVDDEAPVAPAAAAFPWYYVVLGGCVAAVAVAVAAAL